MNKLDIKTEYYIDVTKECLKNAKPSGLPVKEKLYFEYDSSKYYVDGKNVVMDYSKKELEIAIWLKNTFGGEIFMLPRVNKPDGIKTADYLWNDEKWDLKEIKSSGKNVIDNRVHGTRNQSENIIFDISECQLSTEEIIKQVEKIFYSPNRDWVKNIILLKNNRFIKFFSRKKIDPQPKGRGPIS